MTDKASPQPFLRRFTDKKRLGQPIVLARDHPAMVGMRTIFLNRVSGTDKRVLKSGMHSRKLGKKVMKGRWRGFPIFSLTLEERATCPASCTRLADCYGNHTHWPTRHVPGQTLVEKIERELAELQRRFPKGFLVRLHVLGDFYDSEYALRWGDWMKTFPALHVFGFTARNPFDIEDGIGLALLVIWHTYPERWWIRFSDRCSQTPMSTGYSGVICPAQTGATPCCATCGLCWTIKKPIRFLTH